MQKQIVFCLFKYFPHGGLQRDFLRIAKKCQESGALIRVCTMRWEGPVPDGFDVRIIPARGLSNHYRAKMFAVQVQKLLIEEPADLVVGFNKMPGLNIYFASDVCLAQKIISKNRLYRFTPRCRTYLEMERTVFEQKSATHILLLSPLQLEDFQRHYSLQADRFTLMPLGLDENFRITENSAQTRNRICTEFGVKNDDFLLLQVGSAFKTKGVDRAILSLEAVPDSVRKRCTFLIAGKGKAARYQSLANKVGVGKNVRFAGVRQDVPALMTAADILIHPARVESAGMILLESLASSLPVICTAACGYAPYIAQSSGGIVLDEPFNQQDLNTALEKMLNRNVLKQYQESIRAFCRQNNLGGLADKAAQCIMRFL